MTDADRRTAVLAALFARERAATLASRLPEPGAAEASRLAARLAAASRRERLEALGAATAFQPDAPRARAAARAERPAVVRVLAAVADGKPEGGASAALVRLCRERVGR